MARYLMKNKNNFTFTFQLLLESSMYCLAVIDTAFIKKNYKLLVSKFFGETGNCILNENISSHTFIWTEKCMDPHTLSLTNL
jgi:hypothetical protein